jgi:hypothetical protein
MADTSSLTLRASRRRAYRYIVNSFKTRINWNPPINSDSKLANFFDVPVSEIISLRKGNSNPSGKIVAQFKQLLKNQGNEEDINNYLITPFTQ